MFLKHFMKGENNIYTEKLLRAVVSEILTEDAELLAFYGLVVPTDDLNISEDCDNR